MRIAPGGWRLAIAPIAIGAGVIAAGFGAPGIVLVLLGVSILAFYRDPDRHPSGAGYLAPADGRVMVADRTDDGLVRLAIFLNVWHVHVIRAPWRGTVGSTARVAGHRRPSFLKAAANNAGIELDLGEGQVTMRAGLLARRVSAYVSTGDEVDRGDRIGHIAFGSRVDVVFPDHIDLDDLAVAIGDRVRAGETVIVDDGKDLAAD